MSDSVKVVPSDPVSAEETAETIAAIEEGIRDAEAGRTIPVEEVRKMVPGWTIESSSPSER